MCQSDESFINILKPISNHYTIAIKCGYHKIINVFVHCQMLQNFHIYFTQMKQRKNIMNWLSFEVKRMYFILHVEDKHHDTCPQSFQLQNDANFIARLHSKVQVKKNTLVELCVGNYATHDGLVNGASGIFQGSIKVFNSQ